MVFLSCAGCFLAYFSAEACCGALPFFGSWLGEVSLGRGYDAFMLLLRCVRVGLSLLLAFSRWLWVSVSLVPGSGIPTRKGPCSQLPPPEGATCGYGVLRGAATQSVACFSRPLPQWAPSLFSALVFFLFVVCTVSFGASPP